MSHKQVKVKFPFTGEIIEVDRNIRELLQVLWSKGIETNMSCESMHPYGTPMRCTWISFIRVKDMQRVRSIIERIPCFTGTIRLPEFESINFWFEASKRFIAARKLAEQL